MSLPYPVGPPYRHFPGYASFYSSFFGKCQLAFYPFGFSLLPFLILFSGLLAILSYLSLLESRWGNKIGPAGAALLADALKENATLTHLDLWENQIGAEGAACLAEALAVNRALQTLDLRDNSLYVKKCEWVFSRCSSPHLRLACVIFTTHRALVCNKNSP